jgi:Kdo2-lipid IVA lauroyltransferase/acyltransferase
VTIIHGCLRLLARLPMPWLRAVGAFVGTVAYLSNKKRRNVSRTNLAIAYPELNAEPLEALVKLHLRTLGMALLDRVWLWFAPLPVVYSRLELHGFEHLPSTLEGSNQATLLFVPHFVGLEAAGPAWQAACQARGLPHPKLSIVFQEPRSATEQALYLAGRGRFASLKQFTRQQGIRPVLKSLKEGWTFHCSPDQDFGAKDSVFVDFFGKKAATLTVLPKLSALLGAQVIPLISRMTPHGYSIQALPTMQSMGQETVETECRAMNAALEGWIRDMPEQYMFSHRRYKTQMKGEKAIYP